MAKYIILNDGTKWRVPDTNLNVGSGPYRAYSDDPAPVKPVKQKKQTAAKAVAGNVQTAPVTASRGSLDDEKLTRLNSYRNQAKNRLKDGYEKQKRQAKQTSDSNMRELYIAYMNNMKGIPQQAAIKGEDGDIASLRYKNRINYEDNRAKENMSYADILARLEEQYNEDLLTLEQRYLAQLMKL